MRISILLIALTGVLAFSPANAGPGDGQRQDNGRGAYMATAAAACAELEGTTRGLYGLCMAYCAKTDLSQVDLNDSASIKAASPDISILRKYNERRRPADPAMPCHKNNDDDDDTPPDDGDGTPPDDGGGGTEPPAASNCACWTGEEMAAIDGDLAPSTLGSPVLNCTVKTDAATGEMTDNQVVEGYSTLLLTTVEGLALATVDPSDDPYYGCVYLRSGEESISFPLEPADAQACMTEIVDHCAAMGQ